MNRTTQLARVAMLCLPVLAIAAYPQDLPDGPGKDAVLKMCQNCHGLDEFTSLRNDKSGWQATVDDMVSKGATGTDAEIAAVVQYLSLHFGKQVNVNKATAEELRSSLSLSAEAAESVVAARTKNGPFHSLSDLEKVPGVDKASIEEQKDNIVF